MVKFDIDKKGYDTEQVENYINTLSLKYEDKLSEQKDRVFTLRNEVNILKERLQEYQDKDKQISKALVYAVEKAEQIENGARKLYDLEIKRINILYEHWQVLVQELENRYGKAEFDEQIKKLIDEFKGGLQSILEQNNKLAKNNLKKELKKNSDNYIKNLLNKMDYVINQPEVEEVKKPKKTVSKLAVAEQKPNKAQGISDRLKSLSMKLGGKASTYLSDNQDVEASAYSKNIARKPKRKYPEPNESGFDLQEALNPKEDLDEIMKAFDFFENKEAK